MIELLTTYNIIIGVRNLLKQNEQLEDRLISSINEIREKISSALDNMRKIDNKQAFEKDDEVGVTFSEMKTIVEQLDNEI